MSNYYPLFVDLRDKPVLVVGGGPVALRKIISLLHYDAEVRVISPQIVPELLEMQAQGRFTWQQKEYSNADLRDAVLVFCCTEKKDVNLEVARQASISGRLVNVVNSPDDGTFIVPASFEKGDLSIAISTGGSSPIVARQIRQSLEQQFGEEMKEYLALLKKWRQPVKSQLSTEQKKRFWEKVTEGEVLQLIKEGRLSEAKGMVETCFQSLLD